MQRLPQHGNDSLFALFHLIFSDVASGRTMNRTGWLDLMARIQHGDTIVVAFLDQFSRNFEEGVRIQAALTERGIGIVAVRKSIDTNDGSAAAKFFRRSMLAQGAYQVDSASERIKLGLDRLMKSEKLVWVMEDVDYIETVVRRERQGSSHGLSIRVARDPYYRPSTFRSRVIETEETVHQDTGLLGFTTKHIYFSGPKKKFRVRYDKIVDFDSYDDGFGITKDNQTAKPQAFRTGDGWFSYNLAVNLAQM